MIFLLASRTCAPDYFSCETEKEAGRYHCLPNIYKCDRECDCGGCEDEQENCPPVNCASGKF